MKAIKFLFITLLVFTGLYFLGLTLENGKTVGTIWQPAPKPVIQYTQDPQLVADLVQVGVDVSAVKTNIVFGDTDAACRIANTWGCFYENGIVIKPGQIPIERRKSVAHEYMHYVWSKQPENLTKPLLQLYQSNNILHKRMSYYNGLKREDFINELQAVVCTEMSDNKIPSDVLTYCVNHLPNRNALPSHY